MAVPVEEAIAALSTFSLEDDQPEVQGPGVWKMWKSEAERKNERQVRCVVE
ncbi:unnamed protein product [Ilex paraguariensis]|uniref:Uncharacterized protein n=1 Tax=Ilex paraguariensis TaxID=185542 RepID=A0ABC8UGP0_9AQUA